MRTDVLKVSKVDIITSLKKILYSSYVIWVHKKFIRDTEFRRSLLLNFHNSIPYLTVKTLFLHSVHRIQFGNTNSYGHSHRQTLFCGRCHRLGHHPSVPAAAVILHPSSSLAPYTFQTADVIFCRREEIINCCFI